MDKIYKAYKTELEPTNIQITLMKMNIGAARWTYNWGLEKKKVFFDKREKIPGYVDLGRELTKLKQTSLSHWAYKCSKCTFQNALFDLDEAFTNYFRDCKKQRLDRKGFPKFKSKKNPKDSFRLSGWIKVVSDSYLQLPSLGRVKLKEKGYIPKTGKIISATISRKADKWFVSVLFEEDKVLKPILNNIVWVDLGAKNLATLSDGTVFENRKILQKNIKRLKRLHRRLDRKKEGGQNRYKENIKLTRLYNKTANIRKDSIHKATSKIVNENQVIVLENLDVVNMIKKMPFTKVLTDIGLYKFRRQIEQKSIWYGRTFILVDKYFPSSKLCSGCGRIKESQKLSERVYNCDCGLSIDRDLNAAINIKNFYLKSILKENTVSPTEINACRDGKFIDGEQSLDRCPSLKQESNIK